MILMFKKYCIFLCVLLFCCFFTIAFGQSNGLSNQRVKTIILTEQLDTLQIDTLSIVANSLQIIDESIPTSNYKIDYGSATFYELQAIEQAQLTIQYRVYPFFASKSEQQFKAYEPTEQDTLSISMYEIKNANQQVFDFGNLNVEGGLGRALNFGNAQNLVVNSNLNLRLTGELANGITVKGVLTDANLPFQPQGNSSQIRELDKVFLQFEKEQHQVTLGDYEQRMPESYFLVYNKRLQGVHYEGDYLQNKNWKGNVSTSGAVSRGKYTRNTFVGQEANQGPYKLFGANNESFLIILAGTERVFINGEQMQRGQDKDYVIDYNTGEITFTPRRFITNRSRISVEFEYKNQTYNNTFLHTEANYGKENLNFRLNIYSEQDAKRNANIGDTTLNVTDLFQELGEREDQFFVDSYFEANANSTNVLYRRATDTLVNETLFESIFIASTNENEQLYTVNFSFVGENQGNYRIKNQLVNGRVYEFVAPINGQPQGSYEPKTRLTPPSQKQMMSLTTTVTPSKHQTIEIETALSNRDINRISTIGNDDNIGFGGNLKWQGKYFLSADTTKHFLTSEVNYELKQKQFRAIERYRPDQFTRDWNLNLQQTDSLTEHLSSAKLIYQLNSGQQLSYEFSNFTQGNQFFSGNRHIGEYNLNNDTYEIVARMNYLTAKEHEVNSEFLRPKLLLARRFASLNGLKIGLMGEEQTRTFTNQLTNLLDGRSIGERDFKVFIETADSSKITTNIALGKHYDYAPFESDMEELFDVNVIEANGRLNQIKNHQLSWNFTLRDLKVKNQNLTAEDDKFSFLGRVNYSTNLFSNLLKTGFDYEVGSGQEPKREFSFIEVANGEGQYTWIDYNNNGLQEITEFEQAPFSDQAQYVRVFTVSNEYINAEVTRLNQWFVIDPSLQWRNESGLKGFASKLSWNANLSLDRKVFETASTSPLNPYVFSLNNNDVLSANNQLTSRLLYNKLSNKFRMAYNYNIRDAKNQLLSGIEQQQLNQHQLQTDVFFKNKLSITTILGLKEQAFGAENYLAKNFDFTAHSIAPRINYIVNDRFRIGAEYKFENSQNDEQFGNEQAINHALKADFNFNKIKLFALRGNLQLNSINFEGSANSPVQFSMLNGLQQGNNMQWNLNFEREVVNAVQVNLIYDGRKLGDSDIVHTGRARITALFN